MGEKVRPEWPFKEMTEAEFRKVCSLGMIEKCFSGYTMTGADTADYWLKLQSRKKVIVAPKRFLEAFKFVGFGYAPGLFDFTYLGLKMWDVKEAIDAWEKNNANDRAEYERLKAIFDNSPATRTDGD